MHPWFRWLSFINPATYAYAALIGSDINGMEISCVEPQYVPYGDGYDSSAYRSCTMQGSLMGSSLVDGGTYLQTEYGTVTQHPWGNVGIVIGFWIFFSIMTAVGFEVNLQGGAGSRVLFDRRSRQKELAAAHDVENSGHVKEAFSDDTKRETSDGENSQGAIKAGSTTFTFRDMSYFVHHAGEEKQLLQEVSGFVQPGKLVALMGSSGAGKTTLMDVLSQRKDSGRIEGHIKVNGRPQGVSFQRETGYCEQNDVHEPTSTVREALLFSARLRQEHDIPDAEKVAYVEQIMELLELSPLQHAIIGSKYTLVSMPPFRRSVPDHGSRHRPWLWSVHRTAQASHHWHGACSQALSPLPRRAYLGSRWPISLRDLSLYAKARLVGTDHYCDHPPAICCSVRGLRRAPAPR